MIGTTISHYSAPWNPAPERNPRKRDKILEKLGVGGMGAVYKAEDTALKRTVALKFLPPDLTRDEGAKERFIHEAQAASALDHPNICNVHEISQTDGGQLFIAMAYYEGETLKKAIERGVMEMERAADIALQVVRGLPLRNSNGVSGMVALLFSGAAGALSARRFSARSKKHLTTIPRSPICCSILFSKTRLILHRNHGVGSSPLLS